jgi:hypothetical protein
MKHLVALIVLTLCTQVMGANTKGYTQSEDYAGCNGIQDKDKKSYCQAIV